MALCTHYKEATDLAFIFVSLENDLKMKFFFYLMYYLLNEQNQYEQNDVS